MWLKSVRSTLFNQTITIFCKIKFSFQISSKIKLHLDVNFNQITFKRISFQPKATGLHFWNFWLKLRDLTSNVCAFDKILIIKFLKGDSSVETTRFQWKSTLFYFWSYNCMISKQMIDTISVFATLKTSNAHMLWVEILILSQKS